MVGKGNIGIGNLVRAAGVVVHQDQLAGQFVDRHPKHIGRVGVHPVAGPQANELHEQYFVVVVEAHHPKMLLVAAYLVLAQQYLLHDRIYVRGVEHFDLLFFGKPYIHGQVSCNLGLGKVIHAFEKSKNGIAAKKNRLLHSSQEAVGLLSEKSSYCTRLFSCCT